MITPVSSLTGLLITLKVMPLLKMIQHGMCTDTTQELKPRKRYNTKIVDSVSFCKDCFPLTAFWP